LRSPSAAGARSVRVQADQWLWLLAKEWRELLASRAWWVLLLAMGPLVGVSFISAVRTYGELSGSAAGVGEAFSPLVGVWAPTFSACELAAAFLLPFVAIRVVAGDVQSGALKLELQHPMSSAARIGAKTVVLFAGWIVATLPPLMAIVLWRLYGGSIYPPELVTVLAGHLLNAGLTIALAAAAAAVTEHPSTAAIVTLTATVGTWIVNFVAAVQGGIWERAARYTPTAIVAEFQHGLVRADVILIAVALIAFGIAIAATWSRSGVATIRRVYESAIATAVAAVCIIASSFATASWDASENRMNSFPRSDEIALKQIHEPLRIEAHLAPEDPRRVDLERRALAKLRRVMPKVDVRYFAATTTGLFEQTASQYGEIWYDLAGRRAMSRTTTAEGVLETIFSLAGVTPPAELDEDVFRGHPLAAPPRGAAAAFYGIWPAVVAAAAFIRRRSQS
jgi:ABC-2 type transport system permease protein